MQQANPVSHARPVSPFVSQPGPALPKPAPKTSVDGSAPDLQMIPVELIDPNPHQPRHELQDADVEELAASIAANGILQPLLVCPNQARFHLIAGYRRLTAACLTASHRGSIACARQFPNTRTKGHTSHAR